MVNSPFLTIYYHFSPQIMVCQEVKRRKPLRVKDCFLDKISSGYTIDLPMTSEFETHLGNLPQARENEAKGDLLKLFYSVRSAATLLKRIPAYAAAAKLKPVLPDMYWHSAPGEIQAIFQTESYGLDSGLVIEVSNPKRTVERQTILKLKANGIVLAFIRTDTYGDKHYHVEFKMEADSPLRAHKDALVRVESSAKKIDDLNKNQASVLALLAISASFALAAWQTRGFNRDKPLSSYDKSPNLGFG